VKTMNCSSPDPNGQLTACAAETASEPALQKDAARKCPKCGQTGRSVARETMRYMLKPELTGRMGERNYRFCSAPDCLSEVSKVIKALLKEHAELPDGEGGVEFTPADPITTPAHDCCAREKLESYCRRRSRVAG